MKILHLSTDDYSGGASRAAYRLHQAFSQIGMHSMMRVLEHRTANINVISGRSPRSFEEKVKNKFNNLIREYKNRKWKTDNLILHSFGHVGAGLVDELNQSDADILNLHWIAKLLSVEEIGRLTKPIVWTLHDMWAFCGGEHVAPDENASRFRKGYLVNNRPSGESGPDLNRFTWEAKKRSWADQSFTIVAPSQWMAGCVRDSVLFQAAQIHVVPNALDTEVVWKPVSKKWARQILGLDPDKKYILAGSAGGMAHLKGEDLLLHAMEHVCSFVSDPPELLIFGQYSPVQPVKYPCPVHWLGPVHDDSVMAAIYSAADVMVVPSRQDNLPNMAVEAHACGTPVAAFRIGGLVDIISHQETGWLAKPFDIKDLALGISWIITNPDRWLNLSINSRDAAIKRFSPKVIAEQYAEVYDSVLNG